MTKKVLFVHHTTALGGATNSMLYTIQNLPKENFECTVLFLQKENHASKIFRNSGIKINILEGIVNFQHAENAIIKWFGRKPLRPIYTFLRMLFSIFKVRSYLKENRNKFDIIHINTSVMIPVGISCKLLNIPTVWHVREPIAYGIIGFRKLIVSSIIKKCATKIIAISKSDALRLGKCNKCEVIYNYLDFNNFDKSFYQFQLHDELNLTHETKIIVMLGGTVHSKGADVFINSILYVLDKNKEVHFVIVGYPPIKQNASNESRKKNMGQICLDLVEMNDLNKFVTFIGIRNDIPNLLASSHILVWPATVPHFSRPIIEAQAMGVPSIGTNFEVTNEVIEEGETGLTFKNGDAKSLGLQINRLISDKHLYNKISNQAFEQAKERFSAEKNIKKIIHIYDSII